MTEVRQTISVQVFVDGEDSPSVEGSTTLPAATNGDPPWPSQVWQRENVRASEFYRVVTVIDDQRYEHEDTANCITQNREDETEFSAYHELVDIAIQSDSVRVLSEDCTG